MKRKEANHDRHCVNLWGVVVFIFLCKKTWESNNKKIRLSVDGLCNLYAWLFWSNQRAKNKWKPQIGSLCTKMWMSDQNRKCMKLIFLKVHLRRLNPYIWRHIFADPMSMISSIVMDWTKVFEGTFLQTACLGIIFSIDMDWTKLFEGTSMRTPWTPILPCSGLQVTNCFFSSNIVLLYFARGCLFILWV